MDAKDFETLIELAFDEFERYHDDVDVLSADEKDVYVTGFWMLWHGRFDMIISC